MPHSVSPPRPPPTNSHSSSDSGAAVSRSPDSSPIQNPRAIHFGAGNIGRGFIAPLLTDSGYHVVFADVDEAIINAINEHHEYEVHILSQRARRQSVSDYSGVMATSPDLIDEFVDADLVTTSVGAGILPRIAGTIAKGLAKKLQAKPTSVMDVIACENGVGASEMLRDEVAKHLKTDEERAYFSNNVGFANCSVDRIVPPFDKEACGSTHDLDVGVEDFYEWVVDQDALKSDHSIQGMKLASNLLAYVERKLFTLNTAHAIISYLGFLKDYKTVDEAIDDKQIYTIVRGALEESGAALRKKHPHFSRREHAEYINTILDYRLRNPNIKDEINRVARCPKRKLARNDRLVGPALMHLDYGLELPENLVRGIAAALHYEDPEDEESVAIRKLINEKGAEAVLREVSGLKKEDPKDEELARTVLKHYETVRSTINKTESQL